MGLPSGVGMGRSRRATRTKCNSTQQNRDSSAGRSVGSVFRPVLTGPPFETGKGRLPVFAFLLPIVGRHCLLHRSPCRVEVCLRLIEAARKPIPAVARYVDLDMPGPELALTTAHGEGLPDPSDRLPIVADAVVVLDFTRPRQTQAEVHLRPRDDHAVRVEDILIDAH